MAISIHAPHEGERPSPRRGRQPHSGHFNPRSPRGGATFPAATPTSAPSHFNPRSPRGGATSPIRMPVQNRMISIHAPHEGERLVTDICKRNGIKISIHAPHEGERRRARDRRGEVERFQSTLPLVGSDLEGSQGCRTSRHFNPRSPRGGAT